MNHGTVVTPNPEEEAQRQAYLKRTVEDHFNDLEKNVQKTVAALAAGRKTATELGLLKTPIYMVRNVVYPDDSYPF